MTSQFHSFLMRLYCDRAINKLFLFDHIKMSLCDHRNGNRSTHCCFTTHPIPVIHILCIFLDLSQYSVTNTTDALLGQKVFSREVSLRVGTFDAPETA